MDNGHGDDGFGAVPVPDAGEAGGLRGLLGRELGNLLSGWMSAHRPWEVKSYPAKGKLKACRYYTSKRGGVQLCFDKEDDKVQAEDADEHAGWILSAAHLFNSGTPEGFERFQGPLPLGLSFDQLNADVVQMLGEPSSKGGHTVPVWIEYSQHGLQVNFRGLAFDDRENPIASITLFPLLVEE